MKYHIPVGTTVFICKLNPTDVLSPDSKYPWLAWKVQRAVTYDDTDLKTPQIADKNECYEFHLPPNSRGAKFLAAYKRDVFVIE